MEDKADLVTLEGAKLSTIVEAEVYREADARVAIVHL